MPKLARCGTVFRMPVVKTVPQRASFGIVQYVAWKRSVQRTPEQIDAAFAAADPVSTASTALVSAKR